MDILSLFVSEEAAHAFCIGIGYSWVAFFFVSLGMALGFSIISFLIKRKSRPSA